MKYKAAYYTDVGIKKKNNQDSLAIKIAETPKGSAVFAIICDGMGGLAKGELASKEVICAYCDWFEKDFPELVLSGTFNASILKQQWDMIAINENEKLKAYGEAQGIMIGTTLSAMLMYGEHYYIIHVGDSRVYELTTEVTQLTKDQTLVAREVAAGRLTPEQAEKDSRRSILLQCIGASPVILSEDISKKMPATCYAQTDSDIRYQRMRCWIVSDRKRCWMKMPCVRVALSLQNWISTERKLIISRYC